MLSIKINHWKSIFAFSTFLVAIAASSNAANCIPTTADGAGLQGCLESTLPGDTILLSPGVYVPTNNLLFPQPEGKTFFIGKKLTIKGVTDDDGGEIILSGDLGSSRAFNVVIINADAAPGLVKFKNLTIEGGDSSAGGLFIGGGIAAAANQSVTLDNVTVRDNAAAAGGGIWLGTTGSVWSIKNSSFITNRADVYGGAMAMDTIVEDGSHSLSIKDSSFVENSSGDFGGAVAMFSEFDGTTNSLSIKRSRFVGNSAVKFGGAIDIIVTGGGDGSFDIVDSEFEDNSTDFAGVQGGAVSVILDPFSEEAPRSKITNSQFRNNQSVNGGAVSVEGGEVRFIDNAFSGNFASESGGGLHMGFSLPGYTLVGNEFRGNRSMLNGGAIFNEALVSKINDAEFEENCAGGSGGAIYNTTDPDASDPTIPTTGVIGKIRNAEFENNYAADKGGAIANVTAPGTSSFEMATINKIRDTEIEDNAAGVADPAIHDPDSGVLSLANVDFDDNEVGGGCPLD